jgi:hypothetical protein
MGSPSESFGSDPTGLATRARAAVPPTDLDLARPQTAGEEELQLQLALAMSREEAEKEDEKRRSDDVRLALAISQSQEGGVNVGYNRFHFLTKSLTSPARFDKPLPSLPG